MWLNEIIQPPPDPEANRWIEVTAWQIAACDGNACAAAILAYFFARHYGKAKHATEGREDNDIAEAHGLKRRRAAESIWFRATDPQIEAAIFFYKRRQFPDALRFLEEKGFVTIIRKNPNPKFNFDKSRYFRLNPDAVQARLLEIYDYKKGSKSASRETADSKAAGDVKSSKSTSRGSAQSKRKSADRGRENAEYKTNDSRDGGEEDSSESSSPGVESNDDSTPVVEWEPKKELHEILKGNRAVESDEELLAYLPTALSLGRASQGAFAFLFWQLHCEHPRAVFDAKRKRAVDDRLKEGYSLDRIILAIRGVRLSPFNMGDNERKEVYDDFKLILKDGPQVERFERKAVESDDADRRLAAEKALTSDRPPPPESGLSAADLETYAGNVAALLAQGYEVTHLRAKFQVGKVVPPAAWTRILERASEIRAAANGNGKDHGDESPEAGSPESRAAAEDLTRGVARAMPSPRAED